MDQGRMAGHRPLSTVRNPLTTREGDRHLVNGRTPLRAHSFHAAITT